MKKLTNKEREVMELFWQHGPLFVRIVRRLELQGFLGHKQYGSTYQYQALITEQDYAQSNIFRLVESYVKDSYKGLVSAFLKEEKLSTDDLRELLSQVEELKSQER